MRYYASTPSLPLMRSFSSPIAFFLITIGISMLVGASIISFPEPTKDALAYEKCIKLYPQRYCAITYMGAK